MTISFLYQNPDPIHSSLLTALYLIEMKSLFKQPVILRETFLIGMWTLHHTIFLKYKFFKVGDGAIAIKMQILLTYSYTCDVTWCSHVITSNMALMIRQAQPKVNRFQITLLFWKYLDEQKSLMLNSNIREVDSNFARENLLIFYIFLVHFFLQITIFITITWLCVYDGIIMGKGWMRNA